MLFEQTGQLADLEESIAFHRQALELRPGSHPDRSSSLNNLANALSTRFRQTGQLADLEESIAFHRQALELRPGSHPDQSSSLNDLANALSTRFRQTALELRPGSQPGQSNSLDNLAYALFMRFEQTGQWADLEESIAFHRQALELRPGSHPKRSSSLNNLANVLWMRFRQTGQPADLEESIAFQRQALELFPGSHPNRSSSLNNLAIALLTRFRETVCGVSLAMSLKVVQDEIAGDGRLCYLEETDEIAGLCEHATSRLKTFKMGGDLTCVEEAVKAIRAGDIHVGKEFSVAAFSRHAPDDYGAKPVLLMPTCKKGSWHSSAQVNNFTPLVLKLWKICLGR
ncbi:hypothetical protein B0H14DRAFT_2590895 [Mycena olivaceomarginata]|nr:hypothetical protein B0H14DRAFT_2590895 [Mycena olivaceomarginata]